MACEHSESMNRKEIGFLEGEWSQIEVPAIRKRYFIDNPHNVEVDGDRIIIYGYLGMHDELYGIRSFMDTYKISDCKFYQQMTRK